MLNTLFQLPQFVTLCVILSFKMPEQLLNTPENRVSVYISKNNFSFLPTVSKREEFRKYLENSGVIDALTKVLFELYDEPEKPSDAVNFVKQHFGGVQTVEMDSEYISNLKKRIKDLEIEAGNLKIQLAKKEEENEEYEQDTKAE
ncbi:c-Myc-binding protein homolog isoform X1 [Hydra vulgaris]|uniref:c-Myc-binding protein homolog isoform X1 n=1 Tax=Hydra vulgaris TaxID=6087 RepID=UPI0032EA1A4B